MSTSRAIVVVCTRGLGLGADLLQGAVAIDRSAKFSWHQPAAGGNESKSSLRCLARRQTGDGLTTMSAPSFADKWDHGWRSVNYSLSSESYTLRQRSLRSGCNKRCVYLL